MINKTFITIKKISSVLVSPGSKVKDNLEIALTINSEFMRLGYIMSEDLLKIVRSFNEQEAKKFFKNTITVLKKLKGADVKYVPMYKNFPKEVMEKSICELYINAIIHYWTFGTWMPDSKEIPREISFELTNFKTIGICSDNEFNSIFEKLAGSSSSLSEEDKEILVWFINNCKELSFPEEIPFKETLCLIAGEFLNKGKGLYNIAKTATDVLRIITYLSGGDISLTENTRFKSLSRKQRREFCIILEKVGKEEDFSKHKNKWIKVFHSLHIGDFKKQTPKTFNIASKLRDNTTLQTINSNIEIGIKYKDIEKVTQLLKTRPGEFARRLDHILRISNKKEQQNITKAFKSISNKISTRVLMQVYSHFDTRNDNNFERVAFPKGSSSKAIILNKQKNNINKDIIEDIKIIIDETLIKRFSENKSKLGNVWIDSNLENAPIPMQQRSASSGLVSVARGTRIPINKNRDTLRLFIYWIGRDIDLSATFHDEDFEMIGNVSYTNLKENFSCHSGDIVYAPNGAAEFIDVDIPKAFKFNKDIRYIVMNVLVYSGPTFKEHEKVYAGWMTKKTPNSGDIFDPKFIEQKIDVTASTRNIIPIVFDLLTREAIWTDLVTRKERFINNVQFNKSNINKTLKSIVLNKKPSLKKLFELHALGRGKIVDDKEKADVIFSFNEGITPFNIDEINSEYLA